MGEDGSVHLHIHHRLHINEYPIMSILTEKQLPESVSAQTEVSCPFPCMPVTQKYSSQLAQNMQFPTLAKAGCLYTTPGFVAF